MTKLQSLDKFCLFHKYEEQKQPGETKLQFLNRLQREWAISCVAQQIQQENLITAEIISKAEAIDL